MSNSWLVCIFHRWTLRSNTQNFWWFSWSFIVFCFSCPNKQRSIKKMKMEISTILQPIGRHVEEDVWKIFWSQKEIKLNFMDRWRVFFSSRPERQKVNEFPKSIKSKEWSQCEVISIVIIRPNNDAIIYIQLAFFLFIASHRMWFFFSFRPWMLTRAQLTPLHYYIYWLACVGGDKIASKIYYRIVSQSILETSLNLLKAKNWFFQERIGSSWWIVQWFTLLSRWKKEI